MPSEAESHQPSSMPSATGPATGAGSVTNNPAAQGAGEVLPTAVVLNPSTLPPGVTVDSLPVAELVPPASASHSTGMDAGMAPRTSWLEDFVHRAEHAAGTATGMASPLPSVESRSAEKLGTSLPVAQPIGTTPTGGQAVEVPMTPSDQSSPKEQAATLPPTTPVLAVEAKTCPACGTTLPLESQFCQDCGYSFPDGEMTALPTAAALPSADSLPPGTLVAGRYEIVQEMSRRVNTIRYLARDRSHDNRPVILVQQAVSQNNGASVAIGRFHVPAEIGTAWPELGWEIALLETVQHDSWPRVLDVLCDGRSVFAVEEAASGPDLWQVFDDPAYTMPARFNLLADFADSLKALATAGAIPEYLKPELLRLNERGQLTLTDLSLLVSLPYTARTHLAATPYTPPELVLEPHEVDARSPLYSFGAVLYALYLGHELTETDFESSWVPKPLVFRFPDAHPAYARLVMKTFVRDKQHRFPTDEAARTDPTGWDELARALRNAGQQLNLTRLDIAGWSNIGKLRSNNEDAFAFWHSSSGFEERLGETALAILCDGMGGYEAGEVAAAMAIHELRRRFFQSDYAKPLLGEAPDGAFDTDACRKFLFDLLRDVNQHLYQFSRSPQGKRGMGCTCEMLVICGSQAVIAHVGDSRTYLYSEGQLRQLTRDHTLVNRLVELGQLTPEEAEQHPRKNELQQALGAQPFVEPQTLAVTLKPGDWLILCSDGLTGHVDEATLAEMIQRADSAEMCARRLVNLANAYGGSDNSAVIAVRCQ